MPSARSWARSPGSVYDGSTMTVDYHAILPELILAGTILLVLVFDLVLPVHRKAGSMPVGLLGVIAALVAALTLIGDERTTFGGAFVVDNFAVLFKVFFLVAAPGFLMAAFRKGDVRGVEGGLKFFLIGVLSTAVMLSGMSLIYGLTRGQTRLDAIAERLGTLSGGQET